MLKSKLVNLYIYPEHYNEVYNFYNYHKFKQARSINILYKSPSIFLNGLYFELPYAQILRIEKPANSTNFNITIQINPTQFTTPTVTAAAIKQCFERIDNFNQTFFMKHGAKLEIRPRRTLKSSTDLPDESETPRFMRPISRNPITRKFTYEPFFTSDAADGITMTVEIKHIYLQRIFQVLMAGGDSDQSTETHKISREVLTFIEQEFFDFKKAKMDMNTKDSLAIPIRFWIKSNMFVADAGRLIMKWKICDFSI